MGATTRVQELPYRDQMERAFGEDFSTVTVATGQQRELGALGATGAAAGESISFADPSPTPWLVAHELAHVVQHRRGGGGAPAGGIAPANSSPEHEANQVADRVARGEPAGEIAARPVAAIHRFTPSAHEDATITGLQGSFSSEEIGEIYASNWERDFSQGNAAIASAAVAWKGVKRHAATHRGDPGAAADTFRTAVTDVINGRLWTADDTSLGGYETWEHSDKPDDAGQARAERRWRRKSDGLAGYLHDARAYIKDQMVAAIDVYRELKLLGAVGGGIDNWEDGGRPAGYTTPEITSAGGFVTTTHPPGFDDPAVGSRDPIRETTAARARSAGAHSDADHNAAQWRLIGQHLGRAMHAFEDFWAHSNWLELAKEALTRAAGGETVVADAAANAQLTTGTFKRPAQAHALGHKLVALAEGFRSDMPLLLRIYGRTSESTALDDEHARTHRSTAWGGVQNTDHGLAYGPLENDAWYPTTEMGDIASVANNAEELVRTGKYGMDDFLCNPTWLDALIAKGHLLIEEGDGDSEADSHGKLAKDQLEGDKDHAGALQVAKIANAVVFAPLRAIMDEQDPAKALAATQEQLGRVDLILQAPSPTHPLWATVAALPP